MSAEIQQRNDQRRARAAELLVGFGMRPPAAEKLTRKMTAFHAEELSHVLESAGSAITALLATSRECMRGGEQISGVELRCAEAIQRACQVMPILRTVGVTEHE